MQTWIWEFEVKIPVPYYISSGRFWGEYEFSLYSTLDSSDSKRRHLRLKPVSFGEGFSVCDLKWLDNMKIYQHLTGMFLLLLLFILFKKFKKFTAYYFISALKVIFWWNLTLSKFCYQSPLLLLSISVSLFFYFFFYIYVCVYMYISSIIYLLPIDLFTYILCVSVSFSLLLFGCCRFLKLKSIPPLPPLSLCKLPRMFCIFFKNSPPPFPLPPIVSHCYPFHLRCSRCLCL